MSRSLALEIFNAALDAVKPTNFIPQHTRFVQNILEIGGQRILIDDEKKIFVLAIGKAAGAMAAELENILNDRVSKGLVITKYNHLVPLRICRAIEAGHPIPDANSILAAKETIDFLSEVKQEDLVICLISGGASSLLGDIVPGISLEDMQQTAQLLLQSGAAIEEINTVRKHLSTLKGGQLMRHANGATVVSLILSDVIGDRLESIASGLTVADPSTYTDAKNILQHYNLWGKVPATVQQWLQKGWEQQIEETPKPGDPLFKNTHSVLVATNKMALVAAQKKATQLGYPTIILNEHLQGEANTQAIQFVRYLSEYKKQKPACFLMGGETTVTIKGKGLGGRNQQFALAALCELQKITTTKNIPIILSAGTDGTDGPTTATGALADEHVLEAMKKHALNAQAYLDNNDAYHFFEQCDGLVITGPTNTNVMDIVVGIVE